MKTGKLAKKHFQKQECRITVYVHWLIILVYSCLIFFPPNFTFSDQSEIQLCSKPILRLSAIVNNYTWESDYNNKSWHLMSKSYPLTYFLLVIIICDRYYHYLHFANEKKCKWPSHNKTIICQNLVTHSENIYWPPTIVGADMFFI